MIKILFVLLSISAVFAQTSPAPATPTNSSYSDYLNPGWSGKYKHALGYSTSFTQTSTFIYDYYRDDVISYTTYFGFTKQASSFTQSTTNNGTTNVITNSGSKTGATISIAESINRRVFRND